MAKNWLDRILPQIRSPKERKSSQVPEGLWRKCTACEAILYRPELERGLDVCPKCDHHLRVSAKRRLALFLDSGDSWEPIGEQITQRDPLKFKDSKKYKDRLASAQKVSQSDEALLVAKGLLKGSPVVVSAFEFRFMGGSMGTAVGSRFVAGVNEAIKERCPFICFSASGGARMQEAVLSLMQMAKVSAALEQLSLAGLPYISIMTDPVYGGVSASLAMLGDVNIAEPNALIGFTGPRVIEQTVRQKLPEGFQRSEFLLEHGSIDMIVHRHELRDTVSRLLNKFQAVGMPDLVQAPETELVAPAEQIQLSEVEEPQSNADEVDTADNSADAENELVIEEKQRTDEDEQPLKKSALIGKKKGKKVKTKKKRETDVSEFGHFQPAQ